MMSLETTPRHLQPYEWAKREWQLNIKELPGPEKNNPRIVWYHSFTTLKASDDETPWCSAFMCAAAVMGGGFSGTRSAAAISWESYGEKIELQDAKIGDIIVFKRKVSTNPRARHVAFIHSDLKATDKNVICLGGNQNNSVSVSKYKAEDIVAIRRFKV